MRSEESDYSRLDARGNPKISDQTLKENRWQEIRRKQRDHTSVQVTGFTDGLWHWGWDTFAHTRLHRITLNFVELTWSIRIQRQLNDLIWQNPIEFHITHRHLESVSRKHYTFCRWILTDPTQPEERHVQYENEVRHTGGCKLLIWQRSSS